MTVSKCVTQGFKPRDVSREFEDSENPQNSEYLSRLCDVLQGVFGGESVEELGHVEGEDAENINDVQRGKEELALNNRIFSLKYVKTTLPCEEIQQI